MSDGPRSHAIGVEAVGIGKHFGSFHALSEVSLKVAPGTVHGLLGENGAGKSTLVKCLLGYYRADQGGFIVDGREATIERPADADALGLGMVYQHFTLVPSMTVAENLVMSRQNVPGVINWRSEIAGLKQFMERMPFKVPLEVEVGSLAAGERQKTEIIKQLYLERKFLVLDEPTSVLTPQEATEMLGLVRGLAHSGALTIVIITHKLKEVAAFVDEVTVLRRGRMAGTGAVKDLGPADLTAMMIGEPHAPKNPERKGVPSNETRLAVSALRTAEDTGRKGLNIGTITVHAREIVGIAGVSATDKRTSWRCWAVSATSSPARSWSTARRMTPAAGNPGARCARAAGGTAAERLRAADDGGGQPQSAQFRSRSRQVAPIVAGSGRHGDTRANDRRVRYPHPVPASTDRGAVGRQRATLRPRP